MDTKTSDFFHMSAQVYAVGDEIRGNGRDKVDSRIEKELEARKPSGALSRRDAVYGLEHTDFTLCGVVNPGLIYRVKTNCEPQRRDFAWLGEMQKALLRIKYPEHKNLNKYPEWTPEFIEKCCSSYWSGASSDTPGWEILTPSFTIVEVISKELIEPRATRGGWPRSGTVS